MKTKHLLKKRMLPLLFMAVCINLNAATGTMAIGGTTVPDLSVDDFGTGWIWTATTETLSLASAYTGEAIEINCQSTDEINLVYDGNVTISSPTKDAVYCKGALHINGSGGILSLAYTGEDYMYSALTSNGFLTISSGNITISCAASSTFAYASAIYAVVGFNITGSANMTTTVTGSSACGLYTERGNSEISTTGTVTCNATGEYYPIYIANNYILTVSNGIVNLSNNDNPINMIYNRQQNGNFNMTGGVVIYNGGTPPTLSSLSPASGTYNEEVVLSGSNLTGVTNVAVNGKTTKSFTVDSDSQVTFTTPSSEIGTASILVETPEGATCMADSYTYTSTSYRVTIVSGGNVIGFICGFVDTGANTTIAKPADPEPINFHGTYTFTGGWYTNRACTTEWDFDSKIVDKDMDIYAEFVIGTTSMDDVQSGQTLIYASGKNIVIRNAETDSRLLITDISGKIIANTIVTAAETVIPVENGFYIVKVGTQTVKLSCK